MNGTHTDGGSYRVCGQEQVEAAVLTTASIIGWLIEFVERGINAVASAPENLSFAPCGTGNTI